MLEQCVYVLDREVPSWFAINKVRDIVDGYIDSTHDAFFDRQDVLAFFDKLADYPFPLNVFSALRIIKHSNLTASDAFAVAQVFHLPHYWTNGESGAIYFLDKLLSKNVMTLTKDCANILYCSVVSFLDFNDEQEMRITRMFSSKLQG